MEINPKTGRKTILNDKLIEDLCKAKQMGLSNKSACDYVNISEDTLYRFLKEGERDIENGENTKRAEFSERFKKAVSEFKAYHMELIRKSSVKGNWQASAWLLERAYPKEFGKNVVITDETSNNVIDKLANALEGLCDDKK